MQTLSQGLVFTLRFTFDRELDNTSLSDLGPLTPGVCSTLISLPAPGLKISSLWATEATEHRISIVSPVILRGDKVIMIR